MESTAIEIGTRKLQKLGGAQVLTIPIVAVRLLQLKTGDVMKCSLRVREGVLEIEKSE